MVAKYAKNNDISVIYLQIVNVYAEDGRLKFTGSPERLERIGKHLKALNLPGGHGLKRGFQIAVCGLIGRQDCWCRPAFLGVPKSS